MGFTPFEKITAVGYAVATVVFYVAFALRRMRPYGPSLRARVDALVALREPAILLDSARCLALLGWMRNTPDVDLVSDYLRRGVSWSDPVGLFKWVSVLSVPPGSVSILVWTYRLALAFAIFGVMGRAASAVAAVLHALLWSIAYSTIGYSVHNHVVFMILLSLALAPDPYVPLTTYVRALREKRPLASVGTYASYVRFAAAFAIITVYVQTGIEKVLHGTPRWFNGVTLQGHSMRKDQWSITLASLPLWLLVVGALVVVLWETLYGLVIFYPRLRPLGVLSGWFFHEFVRYGMGVTPFAFMMTSVLFVYTPYEGWTWVAERLSKKKKRGAEPLTSAPDAASRERDLPQPRARDGARLITSRTGIVVALLALFAVQWIPTGLRRGVYPFLGNAMFSSSLVRGEMITAEARLIVRRIDGSERSVAAPEAIAVHSITFTEQVFEHYLSPYQSHADKLAQGTEYCEALLRSIQRHAEPRAVELTILFDYFRAGELDLKIDVLKTCRTPGAAAPPSSFASN